MKRLVMQRRAMRDMEEARAYYQQTAPHMVAKFAVTLDSELLHLQRNPATGSPRYGLQLQMPGLRSWPVNRFPYVIFFTEHDEHVVVLRVLHQAQDIPSHLQH